ERQTTRTPSSLGGWGWWRITRQCFGGFSGEGTPGPIPNPEAKFSSADGTAREAGWESRSPPNNPSRTPPHHPVWGCSACSGRAANQTTTPAVRGDRDRLGERAPAGRPSARRAPGSASGGPCRRALAAGSRGRRARARARGTEGGRRRPAICAITYAGTDLAGLLALVAAGAGLVPRPAWVAAGHPEVVAVPVTEPRLEFRAELLSGVTADPGAAGALLATLLGA